jgi:ketosteroid isomerase-like protein
MTTPRTPQDVFAHHGAALGAEDLEDIVSDYTEDAVLIVQNKVFRGRDGARQVFTKLLQDVPQATWELAALFEDDVLYLEWKARSGGRRIDDGIDTFVFDRGQVRVQTVRYTLSPDTG